MTYEICQRTGEGPCPSDLSREKSKVALSYVVRALTIVVCCLVLGASQSLAEQPQPFNVLFIAADDLRTDLGCYGHPQVKTPHLDRLAQRGLLFEHAYCQQAVCNPSRASILTGRHVNSLRIWDLKTHFRETTKNAVTLPEHFKNQGYFTQNVGKIFRNWIHQIQGDPQSWSVPAQLHFASHGTDKPQWHQADQPLPDNFARDPKCECRDVPDEAYFDGRVAALAIDAMRDCATKSEPFFLAVRFWKPHSPMNAPKKYWDMYPRNKITPPPNHVWPTDAPRIAWHNSREILGEGKNARELSEGAIQEIRDGYLANISFLDAQVGKVLAELDRLQLTERTIIVFWSDHGFHLGEHTLWAKTSYFELYARVPLIIAIPDRLRLSHESQRSVGKTSSIVELLDLYPTLVELCGLEQQHECEGVSLVPLLVDPSATIRQAALSQHPRPAYYQDQPTAMGYSIRTASHRYTEWRDWKTGNTLATELYDHHQDSAETVNLVNRVDVRDTVQRHAEILSSMKPLIAPGWRTK